jgi:hypothetical protein
LLNQITKCLELFDEMQKKELPWTYGNSLDFMNYWKDRKVWDSTQADFALLRQYFAKKKEDDELDEIDKKEWDFFVAKLKIIAIKMKL